MEPSLTAAVRHELLSDPEVTEGTHRFGGVVFHLAGHEIGHLHGDTVADIPFPPHILDDLVASGRISAHHLVPDSAWVTWRVNGAADVAQVVELFAISYEHAASQAAQDRSREELQRAARDAPGRHKARWRAVLPSPLRAFRPRRDR